jgi:integrase
MQRQRHSQLTAATDISPLLDRQIDQITEGISQYFNKSLRTLSTDNMKTIINYIIATNTEIRLSANYRKDIIHLLTKFVKFHASSIAKHNFNFKDITRDDVIRFLDSFRKTEAADPLHKWIGT